MSNRVTTYIKETRAEFRHVAWPGRKQTIAYTGIVVLVAAVVSVYLFLWDTIFIGILQHVITR